MIIVTANRAGLNSDLLREIQCGLRADSTVAYQPIQKLLREPSYHPLVLMEPFVTSTAPLRFCIGVDTARQDAVAAAVSKADLRVFAFGQFLVELGFGQIKEKVLKAFGNAVEELPISWLTSPGHGPRIVDRGVVITHELREDRLSVFPINVHGEQTVVDRPC